MGLTLATLDDSKRSTMGHEINAILKKNPFHKNVGYLKHSLKMIVFLFVCLPWYKMAHYIELE